MTLCFFLFLCFLREVIASPASSSLPLPRFACIRAKAANLHVGPGANYPTEWTYVRPGLPVEIIAEFDTWRQIRDYQGTVGWIHKSMLSGKRAAIILNKKRRLYKNPEVSSSIVAHVEPGVVGKLLECRNDWCRLDVSGYRGWIKRRFLWGVYPNEIKF